MYIHTGIQWNFCTCIINSHCVKCPPCLLQQPTQFLCDTMKNILIPNKWPPLYCSHLSIAYLCIAYLSVAALRPIGDNTTVCPYIPYQNRRCECCHTTGGDSYGVSGCACVLTPVLQRSCVGGCWWSPHMQTLWRQPLSNPSALTTTPATRKRCSCLVRSLFVYRIYDPL